MKMLQEQQTGVRGWIWKFPDWVDNEIYTYLWYYYLRSNTKNCGGKTHYTDSQNSDTTAPSGRELYHLQFSLRRPVRKLLDTPSHTTVKIHKLRVIGSIIKVKPQIRCCQLLSSVCNLVTSLLRYIWNVNRTETLKSCHWMLLLLHF
jgi:hypothetical protein